MFAIKLTLLIVGITLYVSGTVCWIFWIAPELVMDGETSDLLYAFGGTCAWMLFTFGMIVHIIKTARPAAGGGRREVVMAAAEQIPVEYLSDKIAEMVGTTRRALQGKRQRNINPKGVWSEIDGQIYYSIRRYEAWLESLWDCPPELNSQANQSAFASPGSSGAARPSPTPKRQKALKRQQIYALQ